jgi:hypothetical protein
METKVDVIGEAYKVGREFGRMILEIYGDKDHWLKMHPALVLRSEDHALLKIRFGRVNNEMEAGYFKGVHESLGITEADRIKHRL